MSTATGQHAPKPVTEVYASDNAKSLFQLNLEVKLATEVQQNKKYVTHRNVQLCVRLVILGSGVHAQKNVAEEPTLEQEKLSKKRKMVEIHVDQLN
jgi:hypothetical protein